MDVSKPNRHGVLESGKRDIVARHGRAYAAVNIALCEDGYYRSGIELSYSQGGVLSPITMRSESHPTLEAAMTAAMEQLLRQWHTPFPSDPQAVRDELARLRRQIEDRLSQPMLL